MARNTGPQKRKPTRRSRALASTKPAPTLRLEGKLVPGAGKGRWFVAMEGYARFMAQYLGLRPYAGTLNVRVNPREKEEFLARKVRVRLEGTTHLGKKWGGLSAYAVNLNKRVPALLVVPDKTTHPPHIAEIVAVANLRRGLHLRNGSNITLE